MRNNFFTGMKTLTENHTELEGLQLRIEYISPDEGRRNVEEILPDIIGTFGNIIKSLILENGLIPESGGLELGSCISYFPYHYSYNYSFLIRLTFTVLLIINCVKSHKSLVTIDQPREMIDEIYIFI